jgi:hypothetical protein
MRYGVLAMTFDMLAKHKPDGFVNDWSNDDGWGIDLNGFNLSPAEIRALAIMGWLLGNDTEYDENREEEMEMWGNPQKYTDEEIVELFNKYKSIYTYNSVDVYI